jgi:predicted outer membrane protein
MDTYGSLPYSPTDKTEVLYTEAVSQNTMAEKAFCKLAAEKAVGENIKSFAAKIAFENDTINDPVIQVIINKRILVTDGLRPKLQKELATLEKAASGFDKAFLTIIIRNYQRSITTYESNLPKLDDVELKRDALSMLAFKKEHLAEAQHLLNEIN